MTGLRVLPLTAVLALAGSVAACNNTNNTPTAPTAPQIFTEVFSGSISANGAASHAFVSQASGTVQLTLSALAPDATVPIGMALGTWTGAACQVIIANDRAVQGATINGAVGSQGSLCARAYDVGNIVAGTPVSYTFTVTHP